MIFQGFVLAFFQSDVLSLSSLTHLLCKWHNNSSSQDLRVGSQNPSAYSSSFSNSLCPKFNHHVASFSVSISKVSLPPVFSVSVSGTIMHSITQARNPRVIPNFTIYQSVLKFCQFSFQNITGLHPLLSIPTGNGLESCHCPLSWRLQKQYPNWFLYLHSYSPIYSSFCNQNLPKRHIDNITALPKTFGFLLPIVNFLKRWTRSCMK